MSEMLYFFSEFRHTLDGQRRVSIPSVWRGRHELLEFYLVPGSDGMLQLLLIDGLKQFLDNVKKISINDSKTRSEIAFYTSKIVPCKMDKQGRVQLPTWIKDHSKIEDELILIGAGDSIQLWSPERWEKFQKENEEKYFQTAKEVGEIREDILTTLIKKVEERS